jgi:peptidyl-prolyl cis-trans isomerase SurA
MNNFIVLLLGILLNIFCSAPVSATESLDGIVAIVEDDVITRSELEARISIIRKQYAQAQLPPAQVLEKQLLDSMIQQKVELQYAYRSGLNISNAEIDKELLRIASYNKLSTSDFHKKLKAEGFDEPAFRQQLHDEILIRQFEQREILPTIRISDEEVSNFMKSYEQNIDHTREYRLGHILISLPNSPSSIALAQAKQKANEALNKLNEGADFAKIAMSYSNDGLALEGGDLGWRKLTEVPSLFTEEVKSMHLAELRGPIRSSSGFHVIKLLELRSANNQDNSPITEDKAREMLRYQKFEARLVNLHRELRANSFVKVLL